MSHPRPRPTEMPPRWDSNPFSMGDPGARMPMALNPPAMTTSRMKPLLCGNFTSLRSLAVADRVLPDDKAHLDAPVVPACRFGGQRIEVTAQSLGTNHYLCCDPLFKEP